MTSLRAQWVWIARGGALFSVVALAGCGVTFPGNLPIGDDDPGVGVAGFGGIGVPIAGTGGPRPAGDGGGGVAGTVAGRRGGGTGGTGAIWGGSGGIAGGVAGTGVAGAGPFGQDRDRDGYDAWNDCNDLIPTINPGAMDGCCDFIDNDCDGTDAPRGTACRCPMDPALDNDGDGYPTQKGDCNDLDPSFFPGSKDICCDGLDHDCDGFDGAAGVNCVQCGSNDWDGDGWQPGPPGSRSDCDDTNPNVYPGATEICDDGVDNDCDGSFDWMDGCIPFDNDGDGYPSGVDCNDFNFQVSPGASEICSNRVDDNCDGIIDNRNFCTEDGDGDGYPSASDCDDRDPSVYPGAYEPCFDGRDSNCSGTVDHEDWACRGIYDADADGYSADSDCNDMVPTINPGMMEICGDGWDNNCDGLVDPYPQCNDQEVDWDRDGYPWSKDCNDGDSSIFPGSPYERCCDGVDSNCDGAEAPAGTDCECQWQADRDGDGYGVGVSDTGKADCNDQDASINPGAFEVCNDGRDNNCNGRFDLDDPQCRAQ